MYLRQTLLRTIKQLYQWPTSPWIAALLTLDACSCFMTQLWCKWNATVLVPRTGFILSVKVMQCLGREELSPGKQCHLSVSVHLWWGWGVNTLAKQICGGEEGGRFPGNLCIDGLPFPPVSSCGLIPAHFSHCTRSRLDFRARVTIKIRLPSKLHNHLY